MATTAVHSLHYNPKRGDCAVHLLVDEAGLSADWYPGKTTEQPPVISAVWIDGGMPNKKDGNINDLNQFLVSLSEYYSFPAAHGFRNQRIQFDAIVITHFDEDHFGGIHDLIHTDLALQIKEQADAIHVESQRLFDLAVLAREAAFPKSTDDVWPEEEVERVREQCDLLKNGCERRIFVPSSFFKYDMTAVATLVNTRFSFRLRKVSETEKKDAAGGDKIAAAKIIAAQSLEAFFATLTPPVVDVGPVNVPFNALLTRLYAPYQCSKLTGRPLGPRNKCRSFCTYNGRSFLPDADGNPGATDPISGYNPDGGNVLSIEMVMDRVLVPSETLTTRWPSSDRDPVLEKDDLDPDDEAFESPAEEEEDDSADEEDDEDSREEDPDMDDSGADERNAMEQEEAEEEEEELEQEEEEEEEQEKEEEEEKGGEEMKDEADAGAGDSGGRIFTAFYIVPACKLIATFPEYLGKELFTGGGIRLGDWQTTDTPALLAKRWGLLPEHGPLIFIVAGDQRVMGNTPLADEASVVDASSGSNALMASSLIPGSETESDAAELGNPTTASVSSIHPSSQSRLFSGPMVDLPLNSEAGLKTTSPALVSVVEPKSVFDNSISLQSGINLKMPHPILRVINEPIDGNAGGESIPSNSAARIGGDKMNSASIACVILSNPGTGGSGVKFHHYFAADALWDVEGAVAAWLERGPKNPEAVMKISHHGSVSSTPTMLLDAIRPKYIYIPNPYENSYGANWSWCHPRWELMFLLYVYFMEFNRPKPQYFHLLWMANYPWYLKAEHADDVGKLNRKFSVLDVGFPLDKTTGGATAKAYREYLRYMENKYAQLGITSPFTTLENEGILRIIPLEISSATTEAQIASDAIEKDKSRLLRVKTVLAEISENMEALSAQAEDYYSNCIQFIIRPSKTDVLEWIEGSPTPSYEGSTAVELPSSSSAVPLGMSSSSVGSISLAPSISVNSPLVHRSQDMQTMRDGEEAKHSGHGYAQAAASSSSSSSSGASNWHLPGWDDDELLQSTPEHALRAIPKASALSISKSLNGDQIKAAVTGAQATDTSYVLYSPYFPGITKTAVQAPLSNSLIGKFIGTTTSGYLTLTGPLAPTGTNVSSENDEWMARMMMNGLNISSAKVQGAIGDSSASVTALAIQMRQLDLDLVFSTSNIGSVAVANPALDISKDPCLNYYHVISLGLSSATPVTPSAGLSTAIPLSKIVENFAPRWLHPIAEIFSLPGLEHNLQCTLDQSDGSRSMVTVAADNHYSTFLRLQFNLTNSLDLKTRLGIFGDVEISDICVVGHKKAITMPENRSMTIIVKSDIVLMAKVRLNSTNVTVILKFNQNTSTCILRFGDDAESPSHQVIPDGLLKSSLLPVDQVNPSKLLPDSSALPVLREISLTLRNPTGTSSFGFIKGSVTFEVDVFGSVFLAKLEAPPIQCHINLWTRLPLRHDNRILAYFEESDVLGPRASVVSGVLPLAKLIPGVNSPPAGIGLNITELTFYASFATRNGVKDVHLQLSGTIQCGSAAAADIPCITLDSLSIQGYLNKVDSKSSWEVSMDAEVSLWPRNNKYNPAHLAVGVSYTSVKGDTQWTITGSATHINFASLYDMFDNDASDAVMDILEHLRIPTLAAQYTFNSNSSTLNVKGILQIGDIQLGLQYENTSTTINKVKQKTWSIEADLGFCNSKNSLGDLITALIPDSNSELRKALLEVPFINEITLPSVKPLPGSQTPVDPPLQLRVRKSTLGLVMWFRIELDTPAGAISVLFVQFLPTSSTKTDTASVPAAAKQVPKRILRVRIDHLPALPNIPIVGSVGQPVDSLDYLHVSGADAAAAAAATGSKSAGITRAEIADINMILPETSQIKFRDPSTSSLKAPTNAASATSSASSSGGDVVILPGHHIIVVSDGRVIVDHLFGAPPDGPESKTQTEIVKTSSPGTSNAVIPSNITAAAISSTDKSGSATQQDSGATVGAIKKSVGPVTITNFGIQVKDGHIFLLIDLTVMLGTIKVDLVGFGIGIPMSINFNNLSDLKPTDFKITIDGMSLRFNAPPVSIAGFFVKQNTSDYESFKGGVAVSVIPYSMLAVGEYRHTFAPNEFKSVFVFGRFDGPLVTLEFAEIRGVEVGFGNNFDLRAPLPSEVYQFPLVTPPLKAMSAQDPYDVMQSFTDSPGFLTAKQDGIWFALGLAIDAIDVLSIMAALVIGFTGEGVRMSLVGMGSAACPPVPSGSGRPSIGTYVYAEMGMVATIEYDMTKGSVIVAGQLTPNSFIYYPDCHLTGGFALGYWFTLNLLDPIGTAENLNVGDLVGDWVLTVGGYHPSFQIPDHYPRVDPLGISWNLSDCLSIKGEAYFAITPKLCMGGGHLLAHFSAGPIEADFQAWANCIFNFKDAFFIADVGVDVSVSFNIDFLFVHIHIHTSLGADVHLQGPPFGGYADVHFYMMGFTVYFGHQPDTKGPLNFDEFIALVRQPGPNSSTTASLILITLSDGAATDKIYGSNNNKVIGTPSANDSGDIGLRKPGDEWLVRPGDFKFRVECKVPVSNLDYSDGLKHFTSISATGNDIHARQMHTTTPWVSNLTVSINPNTRSDDEKTPATDLENPWQVTPIERGLPSAMWAIYDESKDPMIKGNNIPGLLNTPSTGGDSSTINLISGYIFLSPKPRLPAWSLPTFNAFDAMREGVFQDPDDTKLRRSPVVGNIDRGIDERPILHPSASVQNNCLPEPQKPMGDDRAPWKEVENAWIGANDKTGQFLADMWADMFAWKRTVVGAPTTDVAVGSESKEPVLLIGTKPTEVMVHFEDFYVGCPFTTPAL